MLEDIIGALDLVFAWENFFWAFIGVFCGAIMGAVSYTHLTLPTNSRV